MSRKSHCRTLSIACLFVGMTFVVGDASSFDQAPPSNIVKGSGESINPDGTISMIEALSNDPWYVKITFNDPQPRNNSKIAVVGTAEPTALTPGTWVEFKAELNTKTG